MASARNVAVHPIDLSDGRTIAPGEVIEKIDLDHPHQRALVLDGHLLVVEGSTPRKRQSHRLVDETVSAAADETKE